MSLENQQMKILRAVEESVGPTERAWNKYNGDVCCRIIKEYLEKNISMDCKVVGPNAYVEGLPTEFDLLVVDKGVSPKKYTNAYPVGSVHFVIEIKKRGIYGGRRDLENAVKKIRRNFESVTDINPDVKCFYLTVQEVSKPKRKGSIKYLEETEEGLRPFEVFALKESRSNKMIKGEWKRLIDYIEG